MNQSALSFSLKVNTIQNPVEIIVVIHKNMSVLYNDFFFNFLSTIWKQLLARLQCLILLYKSEHQDFRSMPLL